MHRYDSNYLGSLIHPNASVSICNRNWKICCFEGNIEIVRFQWLSCLLVPSRNRAKHWICYTFCFLFHYILGNIWPRISRFLTVSYKARFINELPHRRWWVTKWEELSLQPIRKTLEVTVKCMLREKSNLTTIKQLPCCACCGPGPTDSKGLEAQEARGPRPLTLQPTF